MKVLEVSGSAAQMGEAFGETCRDEISELYAIRLRNALAQAKSYGGRDASEADLLSLSRASCRPTELYDPDGFAELRGIARGAGLAEERVLALNGLTDFRDALAWGGELETFGGCTWFVVPANRSANGQVLCGQTWDLGSDNQPFGGCTWFVVPANRSATGQVLCGQTWDLGSDNQPFVMALHRRPLARPETWTVTTVGCLSLMGMNSAGVAIGTSNLRTTDARPGVPYLSLIHRALACTSHDDAVSAITSAPRAGAHAYYVVDAGGRASAIECTARQAEVMPVTTAVHVHTNHCQVSAHSSIEGDVPRDSSEARLRRMSELLDGEAPARSLALSDLQAFLADREGGNLAICRDDFDGISTNAAIVMAPAEPSARACHGLPATADWIDLKPALVAPGTD